MHVHDSYIVKRDAFFPVGEQQTQVENVVGFGTHEVHSVYAFTFLPRRPRSFPLISNEEFGNVLIEMISWIHNDIAAFLANDKGRGFIVAFGFVRYAIQFEVLGQLSRAKILVFSHLICSLSAVGINENSIALFQMQLKSSDCRLNLTEREIEYTSSGFAESYPTRVMKDLDLVNRFLVVLSIRTGFVDSASSDDVGEYIDVVAFLEDIFVQISHGFCIGAGLNVDMSFILLQQPGIVENDPLVVSIFSLYRLARRTTISR